MNSAARVVIVGVATLVVAAVAGAQSQGPNFVVNSANILDDSSIGTVMWNAPGQAQTSDNQYANVNLNAGNISHYLRATGFGFSIPPAAVILGIEVGIEKVAVGGNAFDNAVRVVKAGVIGTTDKSEVPAWPLSDTIVTYGAPNDLWGNTWTPSDINGGGFGAAISVHDSVSGVLARIDAFSITVTYSLCGDGMTAGAEQCDDGNTVSGDCCSSTCQYEASGSPCALDTQPCTTDECNGAGVCSHDDVPHHGCKTAQKAVFLVKDNADNSKDKLVWKWLKGEETTIQNLGTPTGTTAYTLCVYAGTSVAEVATIPGGSGWQQTGTTGFKYKELTGSAAGIQKVILKSGADGKAKAIVKGKGVNLPDPTHPFALDVWAQLVNNTNDICYTTQFKLPNVKKNDNSQFKAKTP